MTNKKTFPVFDPTITSQTKDESTVEIKGITHRVRFDDLADQPRFPQECLNVTFGHLTGRFDDET